MKPPLAVDLDGTLIRTDLLYECLLATLRRRPWLLLMLPFWLARGRAHVKARLAEAGGGEIDVATLPFTRDLVDYLKSEKSQGRTVALVSAADSRLVERVAAHLELFDVSVGSDGRNNLRGEAKARYLVDRFPQGFVYAGDAASDLAIWDHAAAAIPVNAALARRAAVERRAPVEKSFGEAPGGIGAIWRVMRPHQWAKNLLILVPLLLTRAYVEEATLLATLATVFLFSITASGTYLLNDLLDLKVDRSHPSKRNRPLASGQVPLPVGIALAPLLIAAGLIGAVAVDPGMALCLVAYLALTLAYSFGIKTLPVIDVLTLGGLFTLRLLAGHTLIDGGIPAWLLVFSMALFTSLALVKRFTEIQGLEARDMEVIPGRGYRAGDGPFILAFGVATGVASVLVFMIYLAVDTTHLMRLNQPAWLWAMPAVLGFWVPRIWLLALRGQMHDDPVIFAVKDRVSVVLGGIALVAVLLAG